MTLIPSIISIYRNYSVSLLLYKEFALNITILYIFEYALFWAWLLRMTSQRSAFKPARSYCSSSCVDVRWWCEVIKTSRCLTYVVVAKAVDSVVMSLSLRYVRQFILTRFVFRKK